MKKHVFLAVIFGLIFMSCARSNAGTPEPPHPVRADCGGEEPFETELAARNFEPENSGKGRGFNVIINSELYSEISGQISQYMDDLADEGYLVEVHVCSGGVPEDLRDLLRTMYNSGMEGCILVGDLPVAQYYTSWCPTHEPSSEVFPCDLFYMDLDGEFVDQDGDCVYDSHTGSIEPDIWMGRLTASNLTYGGADEISLMRNYFEKNHNYRTGELTLPERALVFVNLNHEDFYAGVSLAYGNIIYTEDPVNTCGAQYLEHLEEEYELIQVCSHGAPLRHDFVMPDESRCSVNFADIVDGDPKAFFTIIYGCTTCKYTVNNNLGNWYVFTPSYGLAVLGSAKSGSQLEYQDFYSPFGRGETIGESFKDWFSEQMSDGFSDQERCCFGGMTLLGDPTLRRQAFIGR